MREWNAPRALALSRTLLMLFGVMACCVRLINVEWFTQASVFVMAPWAVVTVIGELHHRQIRLSAFHVLLFAMSGIFLLTSLYNRGIFIPGLAAFATFCGIVTLIYRVCRDTDDPARDRRRRILCLSAAALCLAAFLPFFVSFYRGSGWRLPFGGTNAPQAPGDMQALLAFSYTRNWVLSDLSVVSFVCSAMLVAGIAPKCADALFIRRESRLVCGLIVLLSGLLLFPAVYSVFTGYPVVVAGLPEALGIRRVGGFSDRLRALQHPNSTSHYALLGLFSALYCMHGHRKWWLKALLAVTSLGFLLALTHCQSRTSNITLGIGLGALAFHWIYVRIKSKPIGILVGLLTAGLIIPLTVVSINALYDFDTRLTLRMNAAIVAPEAPAEAQTEAVSSDPQPTVAPTPEPGKIVVTEEASRRMMMSHTDSQGAVDLFSNGRDIIWRQSMDYLIHHPKEMVLGMGAGRIVDRMKVFNRNRLKAFHLHNGFLETLARGGVFMLLCLIAALMLLVVPTAKLLTGRDPDDPGGYLFAILIGMPLAITMTEALLFTDVSLFNLIFFYAASRAIHYSLKQG